MINSLLPLQNAPKATTPLRAADCRTDRPPAVPDASTPARYLQTVRLPLPATVRRLANAAPSRVRGRPASAAAPHLDK
ncbi:hypothetical protein Y888_00065 [Mixta calida B021323]|nr:hypothetical protein Y888_00065 [Mixta calida B021323]